MLSTQAVIWLRGHRLQLELTVAAVGLALGGLAHLTLFSRIAQKNIERIRRYPPRACLFGFQQWRGYLVIALMITLGFTLRHSPIQRIVLAPAYLAVGTALVLSGVLLASYFFSLEQRRG
jgi:hypothetical protein